MTRTIFVSGATGTTGAATVQALLAKGAEVVAGVHSPEKVNAIEALGAIARPFDLADVNAMTEALLGAEGLYLVTPVSEHAEVLTKAMLAAAKTAGVNHIVKLSGLDADRKKHLTMARWHFAAEQAIQASGLSWTFLRANSFMQNFYGAAHTIKAQGVYYNTYGGAEVSLIDARDIGDVAAVTLLSDGHKGKAYSLTGPRGVANDEVLRLLAQAAGKSITNFDLSGDQLAAALLGFGMSPVVAAATAEMMDHMATGASASVSPDVAALLGRPPRDLAPWVQENSSAFR